MRKLDPIDKHLMRGAATTLILQVISEAPSYGYQIAQDIKSRSAEAFDFPEGTIYPLLYRLEEDGSIKGDWRPGTGDRQRKVYRLTPQGRKELERRRQAWEKYANGMRVALRGT
jgi:PadR family transcriptional regulator, regulatory protein PadR